MLQKNARIEQLNGMHFYEQDIVMLDYVYTNDVRIEMDINYKHPGIGIVISEYKNGDASDTNNIYMLRVGNNEYSVLHRFLLSQEKVSGGAAAFAPSEKETKRNLIFERSGKKISMSTIINNKIILLGTYMLPEEINNYHIGFYSNAGNTIYNAVIYNERPKYWFTNIKNTNGGRISFKRDAFKIEQSEKDIEIEQQKIFLSAGTYYLKYDTAEVNNKMNIKGYLFPTDLDTVNAITIDAKNKNILDNEGKFILTEDGYVNVFFQGKSGEVSNISITMDPKQYYVSTDESIARREGSSARVFLNGLSKIYWEGLIDAVPIYKLSDAVPYSILKYNSFVGTIESLKEDLNEYYYYTFEKSKNNTWFLKILDNRNTDIYHQEFNNIDEVLGLFNNISGYMTNIILTFDNGEEINVLAQKTYKKYVPIEIESPILVLDEYNNPFDLSSSYRYCVDTDQYIFTNWEREYITNDKITQIILQKQVLNASECVIIYGINDEKIDLNKIYNVKDKDHLNTIDCITDSYDIISADLFTVTDGKVIDISAEIQDKKYKYYIIDYLKSNSYAINPVDDNSQYEVDISTNEEKFTTIYDMMESGQIRTYKSIENIVAHNDNFIILKKNEVIS